MIHSKDSTHIHLSLLQGTTVVNASGRAIGRLREIAVTPGPAAEIVSALIVTLNRSPLPAGQPHTRKDFYAIPPEAITFTAKGALQLVDAAAIRSFQLTEPFLLLERDLMDQQIIDVDGRKVVRVNDVGLAWSHHASGVQIHTVEVEIGTRGAIRRLLRGLGSKAFIEKLAAYCPARAIPWKFVDLVEVDPARRIRLKIDHVRLSKLHPSDIADILEDLAPAQRQAVFSSLDEEVAAEALEEVDPKFQKSLVEAVGTEHMADILEEMDPGAAADLLAELTDERSEAILEEMEPEERHEVEELLEFRENSAAGRMTTHYVAVPEDATVADGIAALRIFEGDADTVTEIYLISHLEILTGVVALARIVLAPAELPLASLTESTFVSCKANAHQKEVAELFDKYNLHALPVVDEMRRLVGVIQADHVIAFLRDTG